MVSSKALTVEDYLQELPEERRKVVAKVREVILKNLPEGYQETMGWGMLTYELPLESYPDTYNGKPLCYAGLAAQKNAFSLYLMNSYHDQEVWLQEQFEKAGKKLDMGKSCIRFRKLEDLPLDVIGKAIARTPPKAFIRQYEASRKK